MAEQSVDVCCQLEGEDVSVGTLRADENVRGRSTYLFQYEAAWVSHPAGFAIDPALPMVRDLPTHAIALFAGIADSAPDRWGRTLLAWHERRVAEAEDRAPRSLTDLDCVLRVSDLTRLGALRFRRNPEEGFLAPSDYHAVPPLVDLPRLMAAAHGFIDDPGNEEDLRILFAPGSSLGGARPKASVRATDGRLLIAKFPKQDDGWDVCAWEHVLLRLAARAGIRASESELITVDGRSVILIQRFDRDGDARIPFFSAMTMLGAQDGEHRSYLEIAEAIQMHGAQTERDLEELWRRIVFSVLTSNTDDHLRNHGFLRNGPAGWMLSPAYDLNPSPAQHQPRILATSIGENVDDRAASLELAMEVIPFFDLAEDRARAIAKEVADVAAGWALEARRAGLNAGELSRMESAFEHDDLKAAQG